MTSIAARGGSKYPWLEPSSVKTDGKYRVTADGQVRLIHTIDRVERALLTTDRHPTLVAMVAEVKKAHGEPPSGVFYINEWRHVLVKADGQTWFAGRYDDLLEFDLDGEKISARAPEGLAPGQPWPGPRVGVRYTLSATGDDVYCTRRITPQRERREKLSAYLDSATEEVRRWSSRKPGGGVVYINEARELFAPCDSAWRYLGPIRAHQWFPEPQIED